MIMIERHCTWFRRHVDSNGADYRTDCLQEQHVVGEKPSITDSLWRYCPYCGGRIQAQDDRVMKPIAMPTGPSIKPAATSPKPFTTEAPMREVVRPGQTKKFDERDRRWTFGQYKKTDKTYGDILWENPQYILWAYNTVNHLAEISDELYAQAQDKANSQTRKGPGDTWNLEQDFADDDIPF